jgi:hypothetical protein
VKLVKIASLLLVCMTLSAFSLHGQGVGASGEIRGTVTDASSRVVVKATVTATDVGKGISHTASSNEDGMFSITGLPPAMYNVSVSFAGFQTELMKGVTVNVGEAVTLDFHMKVSQVAESTEVTAEPPVVDVTRGHQANSVSLRTITDLPIDRRDYLTFTLLMPGVTDSTRLAGDQDYRVKQTPQSGLSFYGSNGRGNGVTVDGGESNDDSGGVRLNVSQEAVQEFQINRSNYSAELGSASGASINIVTKSGTNNLHGSAFGFFRNQAMDAQDPFSFTSALPVGGLFNPANPDSVGVPVQNQLSRQQYGGSLGMPIHKDKTFLFVAFEGLRENQQNSVPILTNTNIFRPQSISTNNQVAILNGLAAEGATPVPCLTGQPALPAATCAGILTNILTVNPASSSRNAYIVNQFESNGGLFPYTTRDYLASGRLDHNFSPKNQIYISYNFGHDVEAGNDVQSLTGFSRGSTIHALDHTLHGAWFHTFSPTLQNELSLQWSYSNFNVIPNTPGQVGLDIPGFANLGTNIFLPSLSILRRYEVADNVTLIDGRHTLKFGFYFLERGNHTESHTFFPGRFVFGNLPGGILSPCLQVPAACGLTGVNAATLDSLQSVSLGLPQFWQQGFGNPNYSYPRPWFAGYLQDTWQISSAFTLTLGLRYEADIQTGPLNSPVDNFAPRFSFAWDVFKNHKTVVRGGYGIYYSPIYGQITDVVQTLGNINNTRQIANFFVPLTGEPGNPSLTSAAIFQTLFAQGKVQCTTPAAGQAACVTPGDLTQFGINVTNSGPIPPLTVLFSGQPGYQSPWTQQGSLGIEQSLSSSMSISLSYIYSASASLPVAIDTNLLPVPLGANGIRLWNTPACSATPTNCFVNPLILQNNVYSSIGSGVYHGGILEFRKRYSNHISMMASYTYSKAIDNVTDFNSDFSPMDETNLGLERSLSNFDQRHKVVIAGVFDSCWHDWFLSGWQLSPIYRYGSGHPFNMLAGSDINGDHHSTNDRPVGIGRNFGRGPAFQSFDLRLSREIHFGEKASLTLIAEGFNLANKTNYASVNNVVGTTIPASRFGSKLLSPSTPLGFTSAYPKREVQLGARFSF